MEQTKLPTVIADDGFDETTTDGRVIRGTLIKCVDGNWSDRSGDPIPTQLIALKTAQALQCWRDKVPVDTIVRESGKPFPTAKELNDPIPETDWELGIDGQKRPPWSLQHIVYLLSAEDASVFTFANSTVGACIAVGQLKERVRMMRALRGANVVPLVRLDKKTFKGKFGPKLRPEFQILKWVELGDGACIAQETSPKPLGGRGSGGSSGGSSAQESPRQIEHKPKSGEDRAA